jgi:hypothetical protein
MRAAVTTGPSRMEVQEAARPEPGPGQALLRVEVVNGATSRFDGAGPPGRALE